MSSAAFASIYEVTKNVPRYIEAFKAHTCYSYQGRLSVDQAFDEQLIGRGKFYLPAFDVCMEADGNVAGSLLNLEACNDTDEQRFEFIYNFTCMMMADDDIDYREMEICKNYAAELGFKKSIVDELVKSISSNVSVGNSKKETYERLTYLINKNRIGR